MTSRMYRIAASGFAALALGLSAIALAVPARAQYAQKIANDLTLCSGAGPAVRINVSGIKSSTGEVRVHLYRATRADWLERDRWMYRVETLAQKGDMTFCMPVPRAGSYAIAIRHDANANNETDLFVDGGGMSNNPSINVLNLGRPSHTRTAFEVSEGVTTVAIRMRYL